MTKAPVTDEQLDAKAREVLFDYLSNPTGEKEKAADIAASTRSTIARLAQSGSARETTALLYARELLTDSEKRAKYLRTALPSSPFVKALPA